MQYQTRDMVTRVSYNWIFCFESFDIDETDGTKHRHIVWEEVRLAADAPIVDLVKMMQNS